MTVQRFALRAGDDEIVLLDSGHIFFVEAVGHDTRVRTRRKRVYRSNERIAALARRLPSPPFFLVHRSYLVNLDRVRLVERRGGRGWKLRMDPPVNAVIPLARGREQALMKLLGM